MKPGVHERKWEIDSLCYPIRLAHGYWKATGDTAPFDDPWRKAIALIAPDVSRTAAQDTARGRIISCARRKPRPTRCRDSGYGNPCKPVGLICSMFRPSDDATMFPFLVPSNFFAVVSLRQAAEMVETIRA